MGNRSARQCRERYNNYLAPSIRTDPWTPQEDALLIQKHQELGPKWSEMASFFHCRSPVSLKNHFARISQHSKAGNTPPIEKVVPPPPEVPEPQGETPVDLPAGVVSIFRRSKFAGDAWFQES
jgi:hypothetical protein